MIKMNTNLQSIGALAIAMAFGTTPLAASAANPGSLKFEAVYTQNDNVGFAAESIDIKEDTVLTLGGGGNYTWQLSDVTGFTLSGDLEYNAYDKYTDIDNVRLGIGGKFEFRPRRGFTAPWYYVSGTVTAMEFEIDNRDGSMIELRGGAGKRFTDVITGRAYVGLNTRDADDAFATDYTEVVGQLDYLLSQSWVLYGSLGFRSGDVVSTARPNAEIIDASTAIERDEAIGSGRWAYRLDADSLLGELGVNWGLSRAAALDLAAQYYEADAGGYKLDYDQTLIWLAFLYRI